MNSDQAGKTAEEIYNTFFLKTGDYRESNVIAAMEEYAAQFKQVEEPDKEIERLQKELDAAFFDIDLFEKEIERLKSKSERMDELLNRAEELLQKSFLKAKESLATNIYEFLQCLRERITQNHI